MATKSLFLWSLDRLDGVELDRRSFLFGTIHVPYDQVWDHGMYCIMHVFQIQIQLTYDLPK